MKNVIRWALCLFVCLTIVSFGIQPALAEHGWSEDPPQNGKPEDPPNPAVGPVYYGQSLMLDEFPWVGDPRQKNKPDPVIPATSPLAWWMQMAVDDNPWIDHPPRKNSPKD